MRQRLAALAALTALALNGCAGQASGTTSAPTPTPTPTAACSSVEGAPNDDPGCAYYDPDQAMAQNGRYKERLPLDDAVAADLQVLADEVTLKLQPVVDETVPLTIENVTEAISIERLSDHPRVVESMTGITFIAAAKTGGCLLGDVAVGSLTIEPAGVIRDGGCTPAPGHE